jgi:hypothetical protein
VDFVALALALLLAFALGDLVAVAFVDDAFVVLALVVFAADVRAIPWLLESFLGTFEMTETLYPRWNATVV